MVVFVVIIPGPVSHASSASEEISIKSDDNEQVCKKLFEVATTHT